MKEQQQQIRVGTVTEVLHGAYRVRLDNGHMVLAKLAGRLIKDKIRVKTGDHVAVELTPYDLGKGRIVYRHK
jgi:translation initiation factor IF-1